MLYNGSIVEQFIEAPMKKLMETQRFTRMDSLKMEERKKPVKGVPTSSGSRTFKKPEVNPVNALIDTDGDKEFSNLCMIILNIRNACTILLIVQIVELLVLKTLRYYGAYLVLTMFILILC
jgi:hypothetical protein